MTPLATAGTAEYRTRNVEGRRARADGSDSHEKRENSRGLETANSRDRNQSNQTSRVFLRLFVAISSFFLRHSLFDIHLFVFRWSLNSCQKNKLSRICSTEDTEKGKSRVLLCDLCGLCGAHRSDGLFLLPVLAPRSVCST